MLDGGTGQPVLRPKKFLADMDRGHCIRLGYPQLDANNIARGVNLSPRHVYELLSDESEPLMKWVWSERLERCSRDLREPSLRSRTIGEIAYHWGFSDVSHFSRAFKQRFAVTPREWRRQPMA